MNKTLTLCFLLATLARCSLRAAILTYVPMQGDMVMPMVSYRADLDTIEVWMPPETPQLTPLLISHPSDRFDPADPWFDDLDPSRGGASFSRRYGFVMDGDSDVVPATRAIWIRLLSASPEVKCYRTMNNPPKVWEPIFGTSGTTNALYWNRNMFHPTFTAPPAVQNLTATFEVYLVDTATGEEVPGSGSGPLVFNWTNISDGRPVLELGPDRLVRWPASTPANWVLESAPAADAVAWSPVTNAPVLVDGQLAVPIDAQAAQEFFRMQHLP